MPQASTVWRWATQARGFLTALLLVLFSATQAPAPALAADLYPADFDPLYDLPLPPAWHDTPGFITTAEALRNQIASQTRARVRADPRLPAVASDRLDEEQRALWAGDQEAAQRALLDSLPDGSYRRLEAQPGVNQLIQAGARTAVAATQARGGGRSGDRPSV